MKKIPFLTLEKAKEIREQIPTPFHVYDEAGIRANARALKAAFSWNPGFREYFAVKATPNPFLLKILHEEGCGCDCATYTELLLSEAVGITGHDVVFSSNVTPELDMRKARDMGVYINLDDATYVDFLASMGPVPETVCLRYNPGGSFSLGNTIMDMPRDAKYGMTEDQMAGAITRLMELARSTSVFMPSLPPTQPPMNTTPLWPDSCSVWRCGCATPPARIFPSSTCPAASAWTTALSSPDATSASSVRACG